MLNRHMRAFGESVPTDQFTHTEMSLADGGGFVAHLVIPNRFASGDGVTLAVSSSNWAGKKKANEEACLLALVELLCCKPEQVALHSGHFKDGHTSIREICAAACNGL